MTLFAFFESLILPESPRLLLELKRNEEAKASLDTIATWNGKHLSFYINDFLDTPSPQKNQEQEIEEDQFEL